MTQLTGPGKLSPGQIISQLKHLGFDFTQPIVKKTDCDSVYYQQGGGELRVATPVDRQDEKQILGDVLPMRQAGG